MSPEQVVWRGPLHTLDGDTQARVRAAMQRICDGTSATHGTTIALDHRHGYPTVINTPGETQAAIAAAACLVGAAQVETDCQAAMGAEDFACKLHERPGAYIWFGTGEGSEHVQVHNPYYDFNDRALSLGVAYGWRS